MTVNYTSLLGLALPATGTEAGAWGDVVNNYLTSYLDASVAGTQTITGSQTAVTLAVTNGATLVTVGSGATGSAQFQIITCTGNPASLLTITAPASSRQYIIINSTSTSQSVKIVGAGPTTGVTIVSGEKAHVAWNGSDFVKIATQNGNGDFVTVDTTNLEVTNIKAKDGTASMTLADSTGVVTFSANPVLNAGTANGVPYLNASKVLTTGSALTFDGTTLATTGKFGITGNGSLPTATALQIGTNAVGSRWVYNAPSGGEHDFAINGVNIAYVSGTSFGTLNVDAIIYGVTVGRGAGAVATNTAVGASALASNITGNNNTGIGNQALQLNTAGTDNVMVGSVAGYNSSGTLNVGVGSQALRNASGNHNTGLGSFALTTNTSGSFNVAVGSDALRSNLTASSNTAVGYQAGYNNQTGFDNTFLGSGAATNVTTSYNTLLGLHAGYGYGGTSSGSGANVMVGWKAGYKTTSGSGNTFVGTAAGYENTTGTQNTFVGPNTGSYASGYLMTIGSKNTILGGYNGNQGGLDIRTASNNIVLSDGDGNVRLWGDNAGSLVTGVNSSTGYYAYTANQGSIILNNGTTDTPNIQFATGALKNWGIDSWNSGGGASSQYLRFIRDANESTGKLIAAISEEGTLSLGNVGSGLTPINNGTGIYFPATQNASSNANTLDDYEQGSFTPTLGGTWTTSPTGLSGTYVKIGRQVYVRVYFDGPAAKNTSVSGWIDSLPFTVVVEGTGSGVDSNVDNKGNVLFANTSRMWLTDTSFAAGANYFSGTYLAAD